MTADISRLFRDPDKQFHGLVHQQGRLPLDSEQNHGVDIGQWQDERRFVETIAPSGSPDDGFRISLAGAGMPVDFQIAAGTYYLGGARVENPAALDYRDQRGFNWLGFAQDAEGANEAIGANRQFLVWLDAWEAVVTATEDSELLEPGLGGPDGAARKRFAWHVRATPVAGPGCLPAAAQWLAAQNWAGRVNEETGLLSSGATLTVGFDPAAVDQDLCSPSQTPGFLGARNECFRVMVTAPGRYVWGQDDAAPLYRVRVENVNGQPRRIVFLDRPRDQFVRPRAGHTVELLRWDQILPNGQKTAERLGQFLSVTGGYVDDAITVGSNINAAWIAALNGLAGGPRPPSLLSELDDPGEQRYFYLRVWTGGGAGNQPDIPFATTALPGTGLAVTISPGAFAGDAWAIAARPNAPARVMPWQLLRGMGAHAPRRHVVPLAFVDLDTMTVTDCRRRFRPLYKLGGCCTVTVGDGVSSWGDVDTIGEAIGRLPPSGGEICIGPGVYTENIVVTNRQNIIFTGCGRRTIWRPIAHGQPVLELRGCEGITVRRLRMEGGTTQCILAGQAGGTVRRTSLEDLDLSAPSGSAIAASELDGFTLKNSAVSVGPFPAGPPPAATSSFAAVTLQGEALFVERNTISATDGGGLPSQLPLGGLHVKGDSRGIVVLRNRIEGGNGNGITLGSVRIVTIPVAAWATDPEAAVSKAAGEMLGTGAGFFIWIDPAGCIHIGWEEPEDNGDGTIDVPISDGSVEDIRIDKNIIHRMGGNGIATFPLFVALDSGEANVDAIAVERLQALDNHIDRCMLLEVPDIAPVQFLFTGFGGIALGMALDCTIRDNQIEDIGTTRSQGMCGIFVGYGEDLRLERNRIERIGARRSGDQAVAPAGGIFVRLASGGIASMGDEKRRSSDRPALWIHGNIVYAPHARALKALVMGPAHITDNRLTGGNPSLFFSQPFFALIVLFFGGRSAVDLLADPSAELDLDNLVLLNLVLEVLGGDSVNLVNLGVAEELLLPDWLRDWFNDDDGVPGGAFGNFRSSKEAAAAWNTASRPAPALLRGGETLFTDNQVSLHAPAGEDNAAVISSVLILTRDDLAFSDNQIEIEADLSLAIIDTILFGWTLRATANRMQEAALCLFSLLSWGNLNNTSDNQTTFLLNAAATDPTKLVERDNLTVV